MYDRVLELITESSLRLQQDSPRPLTRQQQELKTRLMDKFGDKLANQRRLKSYTDEKGPMRRGLSGKLASAIRRRRAERMMKAAGVNPKTGAIEGPGKDPRSRLEKVITKRGETVPQYFFNKLASLGRIGKAGKADPVKSVY